MNKSYLLWFENLIKILQECSEIEVELKFKKEYSQHIEKTKELISKLKNGSEDNFESEMNEYFGSQERAYGWSFLPHEHGKKAEDAFWNLKKQLGY
jgi:hypothetical protein